MIGIHSSKKSESIRCAGDIFCTDAHVIETHLSTIFCWACSLVHQLPPSYIYASSSWMSQTRMTEERKKRIHTDNNVVSALASAASAGVTAPSFRLLERLPWDTIAQALGMLSWDEGVQLRTVSKVPGNRLVLPDNKSPLLDSASLSSKQIEAVLSSEKALKTIQQGVWLTTSLTLSGPESTRLLSRLRFHHLQTLDLWSYRQGSLEPLAKLTQLQTLDLWSYRQGSLEPLASLTQLQTLDLGSYRQGGNLEPLASLTQLQTLHLGSYGQGSLEPLAKLTRLQTLDLSNYADRVAARSFFARVLPTLRVL